MYLAAPWKLLPTTCVVKASAASLFIKSSSYSSEIGEMSTFSLNISEHKTGGVKINNLAALQLDLLKRCVRNNCVNN